MANIILRSTKGAPLTNNEIDGNNLLLEKRISGYFSKTISDNYTFTADECDNYFIDVIGTIGASYTLTLVSGVTREWSFRNSTTGGFTIYVKVQGGSNTIPLYPGYWTHISSNGIEANSTKAFDLSYTQTRPAGTNDRSVANTEFVNTALSNKFSNPLTISGATTHTGTTTFSSTATFNNNTILNGTVYAVNGISSVSPAVGTNNNYLTTNYQLNRAVSAGGYNKQLVKGSKAPLGNAIIINNKVFVSGNAANYVGKNNTSNNYGYVNIPFKNASQIPDNVTITEAVMFNRSLYVLLSNGWVYSWGNNAYGQLGHNDTIFRYVLTRIEYFVDNNITINKIWTPQWQYQQATYGYAFFRGTNGNLYGCGQNGNNELGDGTVTQRNIPVLISGITNVTHLSASCGANGHVLAVSSNNPKQVWSWGYNAHGQLGDGTLVSKSTPAVRYTSANDITKILAVADTHFTTAWTTAAGTSYFLSGGQIYSCGYNGYGQLGDGTTANKSSFTLATGSNFVDFDVCAGYYGSLYAINNTGTLFACGYNGSGQLGMGNTTNLSTLTTTGITDCLSVVAVGYAGYGLAVIKRANGKLYGAGYNGVGQLCQGLATFGNVTSFSEMVMPMGNEYPAGGHVVDFNAVISINNRYDGATFAILNDGALVAGGNNAFNILANGDVTTGQHNDFMTYSQLIYK